MIAKQNPYLVSRRVDILAKIHGNLRAKLEEIRVGLPGSSSRDPVEGPIIHGILGMVYLPIHGWLIFMLNVSKYGIGKYTSSMDGKGK